MWVCSFCDFEMDDVYDSCMFCGRPRSECDGSANLAVDKQSWGVEQKGATAVRAVREDVTRPIRSSSSLVCEATGREPSVVEADPARQAFSVQASSAAAMGDGAAGDTVLVLVEGRSGEKIRIDSLSCILGREGDYRPELFSDRVGRMQVEVNNVDGQWTIAHIGTTNPSILISQEGRIDMAYGMAYPLRGNERLRLSNQTFLIKIERVDVALPEGAASSDSTLEGSREAVSATTPQLSEERALPDDPDMVEGWFIACEKCGTMFQVVDEGFRMGECPKCIDAMDRRDIQRLVPVFGRRARRTIVDAR